MPEDQTTEATADGQEPEEAAQGVDSLPEWARKQLEKARKDAAGYRAKAKELEPLAAKAKELEDAGRSDVEKLTARAEAAERSAAEAGASLLRLQVATEKGLSVSQAKRLVGSSREELEADADELLAAFPAPGPAKPAGDIGQGPRETPTAPVPDTARGLIAAGLAAGDAKRAKR